jgi:hypothetical protein
MNPEGSASLARPLLAAVGTHVTIELITEGGETEQLEFDLVPDRSADFARGFLGESTPLAQAILGQPVGRPLLYQNADIRAVRIMAVNPSRAMPEDAEARRQETLRKAVRQSDATNAILFASSFSGKWGDYDPTGLDEDPDAEKK